MKARRQFSKEFKVKAVKLVKERDLSVMQAFHGYGVIKPEQAEIERARKEVAQLRMEREIPIKAAAFCARESM